MMHPPCTTTAPSHPSITLLLRLPLPHPACPSQAEQLIRRRLEVTPDEPRLWCALGDLTLDDACYMQVGRLRGGTLVGAY